MKKKVIAYIEKILEVIKKYVLYFLKHYWLVTLLAIGCLVTFISCPEFVHSNDNEFIKNLMFSYMGAYIFFLLINYYPERKRALRCRVEIMPKLERLYMNLSYIIAIIDYELGKLDQDTNEICGVIYDNEVRYADICHFVKDEYVSHVKEWYYHIHDDLYKNCLFLNEKIDDIISLPCFGYCDLELVMVLSELKESVFLERILRFAEMYNNKKENGKKNIGYIMNRTDGEFNKLKEIYKKLSKHVIKKYHYIFYDISESELEELKESCISSQIFFT